jgi:Ca2+-dependent lipid-binding protein
MNNIHLFFSSLNWPVQKVKTSVIKKTVNPVWNEDLTLAVKDAATPIKLVSVSSERSHNQHTVYKIHAA